MTNSAKKRIAIFAGPSGGHLFPAWAFAEAYKDSRPETRVHLVTSARAQALLAGGRETPFDAIEYLPEFPWASGGIAKKLIFPFALSWAFFQCSRFLSRYQPDLCVGFGSFVAFPGIFLASLRKIPTIIHEQNVIPGQASQKLIPYADCVAVSFSETFLDAKHPYRVVTGLPIRTQFVAEAKKRKRSVEEKKEGDFTLLILGGSQGATRLNELMLKVCQGLCPEEKRKIAVTHITGKADLERLNLAYQEAEMRYQAFAFSDDLAVQYRDADLAITRAGANTLFELALFQIPAIVIPYPHAGSHQSGNVKHFASEDAVMSVAEGELNTAWVLSKIRLCLQNSEFRQYYAGKMHRFGFENAAGELVKIAEELTPRGS